MAAAAAAPPARAPFVRCRGGAEPSAGATMRSSPWTKAIIEPAAGREKHGEKNLWAERGERRTQGSPRRLEGTTAARWARRQQRGAARGRRERAVGGHLRVEDRVRRVAREDEGEVRGAARAVLLLRLVRLGARRGDVRDVDAVGHRDEEAGDGLGPGVASDALRRGWARAQGRLSRRPLRCRGR